MIKYLWLICFIFLPAQAAVLTWTQPPPDTTSAPHDGFLINCGVASGVYAAPIEVTDPTARSYTAPLADGTYYCMMQSYNDDVDSSGLLVRYLSDPSNEIQATITTVVIPPDPPTPPVVENKYPLSPQIINLVQ